MSIVNDMFYAFISYRGASPSEAPFYERSLSHCRTVALFQRQREPIRKPLGNREGSRCKWILIAFGDIPIILPNCSVLRVSKDTADIPILRRISIQSCALDQYDYP